MSRRSRTTARKTVRVAQEDLPDLPPSDRGLASLVVIQGSDHDLGTHVVCERGVTIGRDADVELPLDDVSISRRHCRVEREEASGTYRVVDLGSTNGTRVNGVRIDAPFALSEGDKIVLGASIVRFTHADRMDVEFQEKLESLVATDALTGLLTKRKFDRAFGLAVDRALAAGGALGVLVMDIDGLKQINDTHGHEMGAYAIVEIARLVRGAVGARGEICRFGGDEFVAYLPGAERTAATDVAERIRRDVEAHPFECAGVRMSPTISIGVATFPDDGRSAEELFRAGDRALYRAKAAGRNRVA
jgi:diguanylate cyclase (GGDEF)-like protein